MREIIFRGKAVRDGAWVISDSIIQHANGRVYLYDEVKDLDIEVDPESIGQFTGLTDKNGVSIFEGDIMPVYEQGMEYYYKVVYNGDCFMLAMLDSEQGSYPLSVKNTISKIIGNIYDNGDLL